MRSELAVISHYAVCFRCDGFAKISVSIIRCLLRFQASEEPFHWAVIPAISPATQALFYLTPPQQLSEISAGIVATLIRVIQQISGFPRASQTMDSAFVVNTESASPSQPV